jgi:hypothetical protein
MARITFSCKAFILLSFSLGVGFSSQKAESSPHPARISSALSSPIAGNFFLSQGFKLGTLDSGWILKSTKDFTASLDQVFYSHPLHPGAEFSVVNQILNRPSSLENFSKRWMRDYANYGFEVLGTKSFAENQNRGLVIDLFHRASQKQARQVLFVKNPKAVVLTCTQDQKKFSETLGACNQMIKNFSWVQNPVFAPAKAN